MTNIDQDFVEYIVKSLVSFPDDVKIDRIIDEKGVLLTLSVNQEDLGRVIGKRGATAQSIRTLLRALGTKNDARYNLKIADDGKPAPAAQNDPGQDPRSDDAQTDSWSSSTITDNASDVSDTDGTLTDRTRKELAEFDDLDI